MISYNAAWNVMRLRETIYAILILLTISSTLISYFNDVLFFKIRCVLIAAPDAVTLTVMPQCRTPSYSASDQRMRKDITAYLLVPKQRSCSNGHRTPTAKRVHTTEHSLAPPASPAPISLTSRDPTNRNHAHQKNTHETDPAYVTTASPRYASAVT
jgi:hypothetical protein